VIFIVAQQFRQRGVSLLADSTFYFSSFLVTAHVLYEVTLLRKAFIAAIDRTNKRLLSGVGPEVVEQTVPFLEKTETAWL
jgi:hypothetical protein